MPTCILCVFFVCNGLDYEELYQQLMQSWTSHLYEIANIYSIILTYNSWKHVDMGRGENNGLMIPRIRIQENQNKVLEFLPCFMQARKISHSNTWNFTMERHEGNP